MKKNKFKKVAQEVILSEIKSLNKLKASIDNNFHKVIEAIINCKKGKIILSGVGKSGIIAKKISSTLSSVGTPSFFVDASSCSHGDLGQISSNDVLILISNSGESSELGWIETAPVLTTPQPPSAFVSRKAARTRGWVSVMPLACGT